VDSDVSRGYFADYVASPVWLAAPVTQNVAGAMVTGPTTLWGRPILAIGEDGDGNFTRTAVTTSVKKPFFGIQLSGFSVGNSSGQLYPSAPLAADLGYFPEATAGSNSTAGRVTKVHTWTTSDSVKVLFF
jgi:hypothetical protein